MPAQPAADATTADATTTETTTTGTTTAAAAAVDAADGQPLVARTKKYALEHLAPAALRTDREGVSRDTVEDLRGLGLLNHLAPPRFGGAGLDRHADRRLHEVLAYADLNVWLIWAQHAPAVARIAGTPPTGAGGTHPLVEPVLRGEVLIGAALSDVRRYPTGHLTARRTRDGWALNGTVSWFSGWGLSEAAILAAVDPESEDVVLALIPIDEHFRATPLELQAVTGSRTERVRVLDAVVPDASVLAVKPLADWRHDDISTAGNAGPQFFGLGRRILDEIADEPHGGGVADAWLPYLRSLRARAYELADAALDGGDPDASLPARLSLKVRAREALTTLSRALVVARAGRGLPADDTAQLHARAALFLQVQGQTRTERAAQLDSIADSVPRLP
ncbi:acyl-CoA dehydrogenase family protein [Actinacidiphila sp. bgisy144]|uniref:acyl-CoA dehydrogenase family protein n=1 Tax=Actinacidiphila sp. bgisy144 TaxID=3413791 RepID=UPI003EC112C0